MINIHIFKINSFKRLIIWLVSGRLLKLLLRSRFRYFRIDSVHPPFLISISGKTCRVFGDDEAAHKGCYEEIIVEDYYGVGNYFRHLKPSVIVDIGANIGMFSKLASLLFPNADIYAYEPNPVSLRWLEKNAEGTRIKVFPYAVCEKSGVVMLDTHSRGDSARAYISPDGNQPVKCISASEVAQDCQIDLLKIDVEGSEWAILKDAELLRRAQHLRMEYHLFGDHSIQKLRNLVEKAGHCILRLFLLPRRDPNFNDVGYLWSTRIS